MKKLLYLCLGIATLFSSCEDALDTTNYTEKTTGTFPESYTDAQQMLTGILEPKQGKPSPRTIVLILFHTG